MAVALVDDPVSPQRVLHIVQGETGVTDDPDVVYTAIVGACVLVCLWDPVAKLGGMAHFLFPQGEVYDALETRFGYQAIKSLIDQIAAGGGDTARLKACLFGGAKMHDGHRDIGKRNADYAVHNLAEKKIKIVARGLGGEQVRRVKFCPSSGQAEEQMLDYGMPHETLAPFGH